jgi:hypothetical protein
MDADLQPAVALVETLGDIDLRSRSGIEVGCQTAPKD